MNDSLNNGFPAFPTNPAFARQLNPTAARSEKWCTVDTNDILLWRDGFWCFREEFSPDFLRDDSYREIVFSSDEWRSIISARQCRPSLQE